MLRDADTGAPISSSCVGYRTAGSTQTNHVNTNGDGTWSIQTDDASGPISLAFYVVADFDCASPVVRNDYLPSWFENQPFSGTDPNGAEPPAGAATVSAGRNGIVACLGHDALPSRCVTPTTRFSGRVVGYGPRPIDQACIFALTRIGAVGQAVTDADGRWTISDLPVGVPFVIGVIPPFDVGFGPCRSQGPPPAPGPGKLQPEFYTNTWVDLTDQTLLADPYGWGVAHGAQSITGSRGGIDVCLTTDPADVVPRPSCEPPTPTPTPAATATAPPTSTSAHLAETGGPPAALLPLGVVLLGLGLTLVGRMRRRSQRCPSSTR